MKFRVATSWSMCEETEVYAESLDEAIKLVEDGDLVDIETGHYIDGSFEVNREFTEELNKQEQQSYGFESIEDAMEYKKELEITDDLTLVHVTYTPVKIELGA